MVKGASGFSLTVRVQTIHGKHSMGGAAKRDGRTVIFMPLTGSQKQELIGALAKGEHPEIEVLGYQILRYDGEEGPWEYHK